MLSSRSLVKSYRGVNVLRGVDIEIRPGEIVSVQGPSGSGKSTLLRALALLDPPESGSVFLDGVPCDGEAIWPEVAVVFQQLFLWPHMTLRENLILPLRKRIATREIESRLGVANELGVAHLLDRYPNEVSAGERQRIAIARAVVLRPKYLLLDEPTAALDREQVRAVGVLLRELREQGTGLLVVSHDEGFVREMADRAVVLERGILTPIEVRRESGHIYPSPSISSKPTV